MPGRTPSQTASKPDMTTTRATSSLEPATEQLRAALGDAYELLRELGQGGMATVYLARDRKHERLVAVKVLRPEIAAGVGSERFLREIAITAQLAHPHVLTLIDSGEIRA